MNIKDLKLLFLKHMVQVVVFDNNGVLVESCNSIIDFSKITGSSFYDHHPMIESIKTQIWKLKPQDDPIQLPCVETHTDGKTLFLDYYIGRHPENPNWSVCCFLDQTNYYDELRFVQQERNELIIKSR